MGKKLQIMKFGGTSLGDAECIQRAAGIVCAETKDRSVVVVVSAISGVTNQLLEAARCSAQGEEQAAAVLAKSLRARHVPMMNGLIADLERRRALLFELEHLIDETISLCRTVLLLRELSPRAEDAIASIGERLSAQLMAHLLCEMGVGSVAVEATELIVTNDDFGRAEPLMSKTRERTTSRILPLIASESIPVVTGYIGATDQGTVTTLGRGGSDYSATILGAALNADEVVVWTDVDGVLTADPNITPDARTLPEISYNEAAELAYFGAKVLHPKILQPVTTQGIPVWIRNSFAPEKRGTRITPEGSPSSRPVKAVTAIKDVSLITVGGRGIVGLPEIITTTFAAAARARADVLMISQSSSQCDVCFIVNAKDASPTVETLRSYFALDTAHHRVEYIKVKQDVAIVAVVGERMRGVPGIAGRMFSALGEAEINILAIAQGSSEYNISAVVEARTMAKAVQVIHEAYELCRPMPVKAQEFGQAVTP